MLHTTDEHFTKCWFFWCFKTALRMCDRWCICFMFMRRSNSVFLAVRSCTILQNNCIMHALLSLEVRLHDLVLIRFVVYIYRSVSIDLYLSVHLSKLSNVEVRTHLSFSCGSKIFVWTKLIHSSHFLFCTTRFSNSVILYRSPSCRERKIRAFYFLFYTVVGTLFSSTNNTVYLPDTIDFCTFTLYLLLLSSHHLNLIFLDLFFSFSLFLLLSRYRWSRFLHNCCWLQTVWRIRHQVEISLQDIRGKRVGLVAKPYFQIQPGLPDERPIFYHYQKC
jgi:hypothetical protein